MTKLSDLRVDPALETEGVWVDFAAGVRLRIARLANPRFQERIFALAHRNGAAESEPTKEERDQQLRRAVAETVLVGWDQVEEEDGSPMPYSPERALEVLSDPGLRDLYEFVLRRAQDVELYRRRRLEAHAGN